MAAISAILSPCAPTPFQLLMAALPAGIAQSAALENTKPRLAIARQERRRARRPNGLEFGDRDLSLVLRTLRPGRLYRAWRSPSWWPR